MTSPRQVLPGTTYLITRRCAQRQLLLRPSAVTSGIFLYVLAIAARRYGVLIHAFCVMSNHFHLVVTDPDARLPAFEQYLASLVARAVNASLGRWEAFWAPSSYSAVALATASDVLSKTAYVLANPVAARLVRQAREWPGLWTAPQTIGATTALRASRPATFFRADGYMPESAELELTVPPGFASREEFQAQLAAALAELEERVPCDGGSKSPAFLGRAAILAQRPWTRPTGWERRRELNPRVASRDKWKRIETLLRLKEFLRTYREAWRALRAGARDVVFPAGTYLMRVAHGVRCASFALAQPPPA